MGKQAKSFLTRNYRFGLFCCVLAGVIVFAFVSWQANANARGEAGESTLYVANLNQKTSIDPGKINFFATRADGEYKERLREARRKFENEDHQKEESVRGGDGDEQPVRDSKPDTKHYWRPLVSADRIPLPKAPAALQSVVVDAVVSNTDPTLQNTDTAGDTETSIAINPTNPNEVVMTGFSGSWGANSPLWHSLDGGATWTKQFSVPVPTGFGSGCPCDQSIDFDRSNRMSGTFLKTDVFSGTTSDPANSASWNWLVSGGTAQRTNSAGIGNADQPWLLVNRDPVTASQDNVYVAYDDFSTNPVDMRVARSAGVDPPNFALDVKTGSSGGGINPGHRLAVDPGNGWVYDLWQVSTGGNNTARTINYMLNRSTDGGVTWTLNGSSTGTQIASADSTQPCNKFGTVNALLGGVDHAGVDPNSGDLYYAYGNRDGSGNNRIAIRRITDAGGGNINIGAETLITTAGQAAIPSVAVNSDGVVAVFYYTYNGIVGGFPQFTARVALSTDNAATFPAAMNTALETFASPVNDDGGLCGSGQTNQRVLGDYMETKAVGKAFFGSFNGNGAPFGRAISNHDPIFYKIALVQSNTTTNVSSSDTTTVFGEPVTFTANVTSAGGIVTSTVNFLDGATPIAGCQNVPLNAGQAQCPSIANLSVGSHTINVNYGGDVQFSASTDSVVQTVSKAPTTTTITSDNPDPSVFGQTITVNFAVAVPPPGAGTPTGNVVVTISGGAETCLGTVASGTCNIMLNAVGNRVLTATYQGDANFLTSNDTEPHRVDKADTTTAVASSLNPSTFGQSVTFTATVAAKPPGAGTPTGTVTFNIDGNLYCINTPLANVGGMQKASCTQAGLPALPAGNRVVVAIYNGDMNFNGSAGSLAGGQLVNKADTTTAITSDTPDPSLVNQPYTVNWTTLVTTPGVGTPTGDVTVSDGTGGTCSAPVMTGTCDLTSTTVGNKTLVATYPGDDNFNGSVSAGEPHAVNLQITGTVRQFPAMAPVSGATVTLATCAVASTSTNASGVFTFEGAYTGTCKLTPSGLGKVYDPISRTYTNVLDNISGADFTAYNSINDVPRTLTLVNQWVVPGESGTMPVVLNSQDNEASVAFSYSYDINPFAQPPTIDCGANAPGCTITTDTSILGRVGVTITPVGGTFSRSESAGPKEIGVISYQTLATALPSTPINFVSTPVPGTTLDGDNNPRLTNYINGLIVFAQGLEGDVAGRNAGSGVVDAVDVVLVRRFVTHLDTPVLEYNEFQRADSAPATTKGNGVLDASDVVQVRRFGAGLDTPQSAGGPGQALQSLSAPPIEERAAGEPPRDVRVGTAMAVTGSRISIPVEIVSMGDEMAVSFVVRYDLTKLGKPSVELANGNPDGGVLTANTDEPGVVRVLVDAVSPFAASKQARSFVNVSFEVAKTAPTGDTRIEIENGVVSSGDARSLASKFTAGSISISGPNALGVEISGRVLDRDGRGLRGATVTILDGTGIIRTATTSSFGFYRFEAVSGDTYTLRVESRRQRFAERNVTPTSNITDVDFLPKE
ncbi:MAG: Ig-like domain repeat protein [Pyrinomonadaceae bacterium]